MEEDIEISEEDKNYIQDVLNWTFSGSRFYYRDTDEDFDVEKTYKVGQIIRAGFFIDTSLNAKKPNSRVRFIIGSSHAAEIYKTDMNSPLTKACELCVFHPNSYFKVMDIYKVKDQYQIFLLHIPMHGIPILENANFEFNFEGGENGVDYFVNRARASFDEKLKMTPDEKLESPEWKDRTGAPVGTKSDGSLFGLEFEYPKTKQMNDLELGFRRLANDFDQINMPIKEQ